MFKKLQDYAIKQLMDLEIEHKIKPTFTVENWRLNDQIWTKQLPDSLGRLGYLLSPHITKKGYRLLMTPQEPVLNPELLKHISRC